MSNDGSDLCLTSRHGLSAQLLLDNPGQLGIYLNGDLSAFLDTLLMETYTWATSEGRRWP